MAMHGSGSRANAGNKSATLRHSRMGLPQSALNIPGKITFDYVPAARIFYVESVRRPWARHGGGFNAWRGSRRTRGAIDDRTKTGIWTSTVRHRTAVRHDGD